MEHFDWLDKTVPRKIIIHILLAYLQIELFDCQEVPVINFCV